MDNSISTNEASKKLKKDLGLTYTVGKEVVALFFNLVHESSQGNYWEPKVNYDYLVAESESFNDVKNRIKAKVTKFWFKDRENNPDDIFELIPEQSKRKELYTGAFKIKSDNGGKKLPNQVIIAYLIKNLGHYDQNHKGSHNF